MAKGKPSRTQEVDESIEELKFEAAVEELEQIISRIEQGEVGLEESLAQWKRGQALIKRCRSILDVAEQQVQQLSMNDMGGATPKNK